MGYNGVSRNLNMIVFFFFFFEEGKTDFINKVAQRKWVTSVKCSKKSEDIKRVPHLILKGF